MAKDIRVLLIDDKSSDVKFFRHAVAGMGEGIAELMAIGSLQAACEWVESERVDVAIIDLSTNSGLDGFREFKSRCGRVPIVVLMNSEESSLAVEAISEGARDYLDRDMLSSDLLYSILREAVGEGRSATDAPGAAASLEDPTSGRPTILVVDDVDGVRDLIREILEMHGYSVLLAGDGRQALELAEGYPDPIDLLLTDVVMPQMGGRELADRLAEAHPETKIIFMSGYSDDAIAHHGVLQPGTAFIKKPFTSDTLTQRIREELAAL